jgi:2-amino-4-hydroxy-6-hydroxymethyldihydropteridine diphosphokinase
VIRAWIALGSNLDDPRQQVLRGMDAIAQLPHTKVLQRSHLYRTPPWGVLDQADFVNAAVGVETALAPAELLAGLLAIEDRAGRVRNRVNGPRTLDLDLLLVDGVRCADPTLTLPHPRMTERAFVLLPLNDIAPELPLSATLSVAAQLARLDVSGCVRID